MLFCLRIKKKVNYQKSAKSSRLLLAALTAFFALSFNQEASAQTVVEQMLNKKPEKTKKTSLEIPAKNKNTRRKAAAPTPAKPSASIKTALPRRARNAKTTPKVEERMEVVFLTGATGVEIMVDGKSIGFSGKDAKLAAWVPTGEREVFARKYEQNLFPAEKIKISAENNNIDLSAKVAKGVDELKQNGQTASNQPNVETKTLDVVGLLNAYRDPLKINSVTAKDWQAVYEQSQRKLMFGSTDNDVEGLYTFAQGQVELSLGNKVKALTLFEAAANIYMPNSAMMHYGLGAARLSGGASQEAGAAFAKAVQLDPQYALAYKGLGDVYLAQNKPREAATQYQQAQKLGMTTPDLRLKLAEVQIRNKNCAGAMKELEVLRAEAPTAGVMLLLSECYLEEKRAVSAIEALEKAIELDPNSAVIHQRLGAIYLKQKEYGKAKESLERALALDSENKLNRKELKEMINKAQKNAR